MFPPRSRTWAPWSVLIVGLLLAPAAAWAEGESLDLEMLQAGFSGRAMPGVDGADVDGKGAMRVGTVLQYEQEPLMLYAGEDEEIAIVSHRADAQLGVSYDWSDRISTRLVLPVTYQAGSDVPSMSAEGVGARDIALGGRVGLTNSELVAVSARVDIHVPSGRRLSYMGEESARLDAGLLGRGRLGPVELLLDGGITGRRSVDTGYDLTLGTEVVGNLGVRHNSLNDRLALGAALLTRSGTRTVLDSRGRTRAEALGVLQAWPVQRLQVDLAVGRGLTRGYGTTGGRVMLGITWVARVVDVPEEDFDLYGRDLPEELPERVEPTLVLEDDSEEDITWKHGELARVYVQEDRSAAGIAIRDDIQFEVGTARILPESLPVLDQVAELMAAYWQIDHLIIEGHASEEGSFDFNFELSIERARAIYTTLVERGVHPVRLSFRGFGEVDPVVTAPTEAGLARNRRVELDIVKLLDPLDPPPTYESHVRLPWSGEIVAVRQARERLVGQEIDFQTPVGPSDDEQAADLLQRYLDEDEGPDQDDTAAPGDGEPDVDPEELLLPDDVFEDDQGENKQ